MGPVLATGPYEVDLAQHAGGSLRPARSLAFIDITGSVVYTLVVPYAAIALTLFHFDLQARRRLDTAPHS